MKLIARLALLAALAAALAAPPAASAANGKPLAGANAKIIWGD